MTSGLISRLNPKLLPMDDAVLLKDLIPNQAINATNIVGLAR
jgi:hypothetical protein